MSCIRGCHFGQAKSLALKGIGWLSPSSGRGRAPALTSGLGQLTKQHPTLLPVSFCRIFLSLCGNQSIILILWCAALEKSHRFTIGVTFRYIIRWCSQAGSSFMPFHSILQLTQLTELTCLWVSVVPLLAFGCVSRSTALSSTSRPATVCLSATGFSRLAWRGWDNKTALVQSSSDKTSVTNLPSSIPSLQNGSTLPRPARASRESDIFHKMFTKATTSSLLVLVLIRSSGDRRIFRASTLSPEVSQSWGYPAVLRHFRLGFALMNQSFGGTPMTQETSISGGQSFRGKSPRKMRETSTVHGEVEQTVK